MYKCEILVYSGAYSINVLCGCNLERLFVCTKDYLLYLPLCCEIPLVLNRHIGYQIPPVCFSSLSLSVASGICVSWRTDFAKVFFTL